MTTENLPPIEWETPHPSVTNWVRSGIYQHLLANMDKHIQKEEGDDRHPSDV